VRDPELAYDIDCLTVGPFQSNCYVVRPGEGGVAVIVDPGAESERNLAHLAERHDDVAAILLTHAHLDHVGAVAAVARATGAPIHLHPDDRFLYDAVEETGRLYGVEVERPPEPDVALTHGMKLEFGDLRWTVRHSPGHSPGGVVFVGDGIALVGDSVFAGSIGRTDLPGGDTQALLAAIRREILTLPPETILLPGHMGATTVEREAATNPFFVPGGGYA
jgi:glyoxylase-like metal-dependent hydrolase (beta-lactamase superfamily II)